MLKPNKSRKSDQPRITADLTSSQLVLAICVFLCAALVCFAMGVIVGKYDERNSSREREARLAANPAPQPARLISLPATPKPGSKPAPSPAPGQGVQTSPRVPAAPPMPGYPDSPGKPAVALNPQPTQKEHPQPPKPADATQKPPAAADPDTSSEAPKQTDQTTATPPAPTPPSPVAQKSPAVADNAEPAVLEPVVKQEQAAPVAAPAPELEAVAAPPALEPLTKPAQPPQAPPPATAPPVQDVYTIQVAALSSTNRERQALDLKKKLEAEGLQPELISTRNGARICVVAGSYPDRKTAQAACNELRKSKGYSDCFVRTR